MTKVYLGIIIAAMDWLKKLELNHDRAMGARLVALILLVMLVALGWQVVRPLLFNADPYDFNSHYLASYATQHGLDPYDLDTLNALRKELHIPKVTIFRYPPFWLILLTPLGAMPYPVAVLTWRLLNLALIVVSVWLTFKALRLNFDGKNALVIGLLLFNFDPLIYNIAIGNTNLVILVLLIGTLIAYTRGRHGWSGVLLGLASAIKVTPAIFIVYFLWKKNYRLVASTIATILASIVLGFVMLGERMTRTFVDVLTAFAAEDNAWIGNQSLRGFLDRIFVGDDTVPAAIADPNLGRLLYYGGVLLFAVLTAWVLFRARRPDNVHLEFAFGLLAYYIVAPTSWVHHFVWMIYSLVTLALASLEHKRLAPTIIFGIGYLLIALTLEYRNEALFQWPQAIWISSKFYGLLILYGLNAWLLLRPPQTTK